MKNMTFILISFFLPTACSRNSLDVFIGSGLPDEAQMVLEEEIGSMQSVGYAIESSEKGVPQQPLLGTPFDEAWCVKLDREVIVDLVNFRNFIVYKSGLSWWVYSVGDYKAEETFKLNSCSNWH
jgi:hypothetical protein